jgi:hypothetical protein
VGCDRAYGNRDVRTVFDPEGVASDRIKIHAYRAVIIWWASIPPRNDRQWYRDVARLAHVTFDGDLVTIANVRNFNYRSETDYTERWETRTYDLGQARGFDMLLSFWGPALIAQTIASCHRSTGLAIPLHALPSGVGCRPHASPQAGQRAHSTCANLVSSDHR